MVISWFACVAACIVCSSAADLDSIEIPYRKHNFEVEKFDDITLTHTGQGCTAEGKTFSFGQTFTIQKTGPCIQYDCLESGVKLNLDHSGCEDETRCKKNEFTIHGCTKHVCKLSDVKTGNTFSVTREIKAITDKQCNHLGICHPLKVPFHVEFHGHGAECTCHDVDHFHCVL